MNTLEQGVYSNPKFQDLDIGAVMRTGHPDIEDGDRHILDSIHRLRDSLGRPLRILDVGSGSGHLSVMLAKELPDCEVIANEVEAGPIRQARSKLAGFANATVFDRAFANWQETVDVVISWGSHHHLEHDYLRHVQEVLASDGLFIAGDELCPEYLTGFDKARLADAKSIQIVDGYIFDNAPDIEEYRSTGVVPEWNLYLEEARRKALWEWYKFVGDYAMAHGSWTVLITELEIARDDLITQFAGEHKTSPYLLERELILSGFAIMDTIAIGNREPSLQSFYVYTCRPIARF